jgi:hypothetical protein
VRDGHGLVVAEERLHPALWCARALDHGGVFEDERIPQHDLHPRRELEVLPRHGRDGVVNYGGVLLQLAHGRQESGDTTDIYRGRHPKPHRLQDGRDGGDAICRVVVEGVRVECGAGALWHYERNLPNAGRAGLIVDVEEVALLVSPAEQGSVGHHARGHLLAKCQHHSHVEVLDILDRHVLPCAEPIIETLNAERRLLAQLC